MLLRNVKTANDEFAPAWSGGRQAEEAEISGLTRTGLQEQFEIDGGVPEFRIIENDGQRFGHLAGLPEGENLEEFVERTETSREHDEGSSPHGEMHLAHGEIMEAESEVRGGIGIWLLLTGQRDVVANGRRAGIGGSAVGCFHDAGTAAGCNDIVAGYLVIEFRATME